MALRGALARLAVSSLSKSLLIEACFPVAVTSLLSAAVRAVLLWRMPLLLPVPPLILLRMLMRSSSPTSNSFWLSRCRPGAAPRRMAAAYMRWLRVPARWRCTLACGRAGNSSSTTSAVSSRGSCP
jgi:hypothetical protein